MRKLVLNVETLRNLQNAELSQVAGGHGIGNNIGNGSRCGCNPAYLHPGKESIVMCHLPIPPDSCGIHCVAPYPLAVDVPVTVQPARP